MVARRVVATLLVGIGMVLGGCGAAGRAPTAGSGAKVGPPPSGAPVSGTYQITAPSTASYTAHETFLQNNLPNAPVGVTSEVRGTLVLSNGRFEASTVQVNLTGLHTHNAMRDAHVQQTLDTAKYPDATFQVTGEAPRALLVRDHGTATVSMQGKLTIHGVTHPALWHLQVGLVQGALRVQGTTTIQMTAFGVQPPSLAGFVKVKPGLLLTVDLTASRS